MAFTDENDHRGGLSPGLVVALVIGSLIVVAGLVVAIARTAGGDDDPAPPRNNAASSSKCGLPDGDQDVPTAAPEARWELTGNFATPTSDVLGPARKVRGVPVCFAHSPSGAVVAAISYLGATTEPAFTREDLVKSRVLLDEAGKRLLLTDAESTPAKYQLAGFRVTDATTDRVTVELAVRSNEGPTAGQLYSLGFTLGWSDGDWKIVVPPTGQPPTSAVSSLNGFVEWSVA